MYKKRQGRVIDKQLGTLSNDDGDTKESGEKAIRLDWQNNNFARASLFFVHFFAVVAWRRRETS